MAVFVAAVETGSLSAASRQLRMPLPTVSRKISELESHIKTRLLLRSTRKLTLTEAGRNYLDACKRILQQVTEAERAAAGEYSAPTGELIVTAPIVFGRLHVLPVTAAFLKAYPDVQIRLVLGDRALNLQEDHIDLAIRIGELPDSTMIAKRVGMIRSVACASPGYLAKRGTPKRPQDLIRHDCVSFTGLTSSDLWRFRSGGSELAVPIRSRLAVNTAEAAIDAAIAGVGVTRVLSYQVEQPVASRQLRVILKKFESEPIPVNLVHAGQRLLPLKLRAFLDFAAPRLRVALES